MRQVWWSWDVRMRWSHGFCGYPDSFVDNYRKMVDAAARYGVEGIVIWGFLRDRHGGIDTARRVVDYAREHGVSIFPGVGIDCYGGIYYDGDSPYSLDVYLADHPESQAVNADGSPMVYRHNAHVDAKYKPAGCPADDTTIAWYREGLAWLVETFDLAGFQIEQGDKGLCHCERCRSLGRVTTGWDEICASATDAARRIPAVIAPVLAARPELTIVSETYAPLTTPVVDSLRPLLASYPEAVTISWQAYYGPADGHGGAVRIEAGIRSPTVHGNAAILTNNDPFQGEVDDRENIAAAVTRAREVGLDMTYIYGEYPDAWPLTRGNYAAWARAAGA